jgi:hypothetical protein
MSQEINITIFHPPTSRTDAISLPPSATLSDLASFASALLDLDGQVVITKDRAVIFSQQNASSGDTTLHAGGIKNGDFLTVLRVSEVRSSSNGSPARQRVRVNPPPAPSGGLDFSALLAGSNAQSSTSQTSAGLSFNIAGLAAAAGGGASPVEWDKMNLDDAIHRNPNPVHLMTLFNSPKHPNLLKELNYHNPQVYKKLISANGDVNAMASIWRETMMKSTTMRFLQRHGEQSKESEMRSRLSSNPQDEEANKYFGEKIRKENVQRQYEQMMEEYPESMGRGEWLSC